MPQNLNSSLRAGISFFIIASVCGRIIIFMLSRVVFEIHRHDQPKIQNFVAIENLSCRATKCQVHIMLRAKKPVTDFRYPRACRFRKTKQTYQFRSPAPSTNFFQNVIFKIHKMCLKLAKIEFSHFFYCIRYETVSGVFHYLQNVKIAEKSFLISQFLPILATCYEF
jgi:hypothetical protein